MSSEGSHLLHEVNNASPVINCTSFGKKFAILFSELLELHHTLINMPYTK